MASDRTRVQLCGPITIRIGGRRIEQLLPGRQGRVLFAFLVVRRAGPTTRDELADAIWGEAASAAHDAALAALLSKLRATLGAGLLQGKSELRLVLPAGAWIDLEAAAEGAHRAESAVALGDFARAWGPARVALHAARRPFLHGHDLPWIERVREQLAETHLRALECIAASSLGLGGPELGSAERSARALIEAAPFRESGHRYLMQTMIARGNAAEAMLVYDALRRRLHEELGVAPSPLTQELHRRLLCG